MDLVRAWPLAVAGAVVACEQKMPPVSETDLHLHADTVAPGGSLEVDYTCVGCGPKAWVGIVPADIPHGSESVNDQHDTHYIYLQGGRGSGTLRVPDEPGRYDVRLHDRDDGGRELQSRPFTVDGPIVPAGRVFIPGAVVPGRPMTLHWNCDRCSDPVLTVVANDRPEASPYREFRATSGIATFTAPDGGGYRVLLRPAPGAAAVAETEFFSGVEEPEP